MHFKSFHDPTGFLPGLGSRTPPCRAVCIIFRLCGKLLVGRPGRMICAGLRLCGRWYVICLNRAICVVFRLCRRSCANRLGRTSYFTRGLCRGLTFCRAGGFRFVLAVNQRFLHQGRGLRTFRRQCLGHCIGAGCLFLRFKALHRPTGFLPLQLGNLHSFVGFPFLQRRGLRSPVGFLSSPGSRMPPCRAVCIIFRLCGRVCVICPNRAICTVFCRCRRSCVGRLVRMGGFARGSCGGLVICRAGGFGFRFVLAIDQRFLHRGRGLHTFHRPCLPLFLCRSSATLHPACLARIPGVGGWLGAGSTGWMRALFCVLTVVR